MTEAADGANDLRRAPGTGRWLRLVLAALYAAMAAAQFVSLNRMAGILGAYGLVHGAAATVLALGLIAGEAACGVWFPAARARTHPHRFGCTQPSG